MKRILFPLMLLLILLLLPSCKNNGKMTVSDLKTNKSIFDPVYILEGNEYVPYIVVSNNYCGNTLLLRKDVLESNKRFNSYSSLYEGSEIDNYLNGEFLNNLVDYSAIIKKTAIDVTKDSSIGYSGQETYSIERKVFLLSYDEVCSDKNPNAAKEGTHLKFFQKDENRIALKSGQAHNWWLRTPDTYYMSCPYCVSSNGKIDAPNAFDLCGIRPAFCIPGNTPIVKSNNVVGKKSVFVLYAPQE